MEMNDIPLKFDFVSHVQNSKFTRQVLIFFFFFFKIFHFHYSLLGSYLTHATAKSLSALIANSLPLIWYSNSTKEEKQKSILNIKMIL